MIRVSNRLVIPTTPRIPACVVRIGEILSQTIKVNIMACCYTKIRPCIVQGQTKTFLFQDAASVDFTGATEITFDIWQGGIGGISLLSYSLTGGQIVLLDDNQFRLIIDNSVSVGFPAGQHYCEAWVTRSDGEPVPVGMGPFDVEDSRKYDA